MPGRTGLELARELTAIKPMLPVVVITGSVLSSELLEELQDPPMGLLEETVGSIRCEVDPGETDTRPGFLGSLAVQTAGLAG
jgi:CheY-like chemotaxis protein